MTDADRSVTNAKGQYRNRVYQFIYQRGQTCRQEISHSLGISMPTVLQNVKELICEGYICELGRYASAGGRKAAILSPVSQVRYALGISFSCNHIQFAMADALGDMLSFSRERHAFSNTQQYFARLEEYIAHFVMDSGVDPSRILGCGVSLPAIFDRTGENILTSRILGLTSVCCTAFTSHIPFNCVFINESNANCIAEMKALGNGLDNYVHVTVSDCLGGAIFIDGRLYQGDTLRDAEFGHIRLHPGGKTCFCGQKGCSNSYLSTSILAQCANGNLEAFFEGLKAGNAEFERVWNTYLDDLALLLNNLRMAFDCHVILGGELGYFIHPYLDCLHRRLADINAFWMDDKYVKPCLMQQGAAPLGAALQVIQQFIDGV
ncbi:MAG: ROK family transcriptional regulator [Clostridia bacterium]|nr:ROK family transcriptional regulator [Clostridia bacterium]